MTLNSNKDGVSSIKNTSQSQLTQFATFSSTWAIFVPGRGKRTLQKHWSNGKLLPTSSHYYGNKISPEWQHHYSVHLALKPPPALLMTSPPLNIALIYDEGSTWQSLGLLPTKSDHSKKGITAALEALGHNVVRVDGLKALVSHPANDNTDEIINSALKRGASRRRRSSDIQNGSNHDGNGESSKPVITRRDR